MKRILIPLFLTMISLSGCREALDNFIYNADIVKMIKEIEQEAINGDADAQYNLYLRYKYGDGVTKDETKSFYWQSMAAKYGNDEAQYWLAAKYAMGWGVTKDNTKAAYWYTQSAMQGNTESQYFLGDRYHLGLGVPKDNVIAYAWYYIATENGHINATFSKANTSVLLTSEEITEGAKIASNWKVGQNIKRQNQ
jgi:TPR repeat protein